MLPKTHTHTRRHTVTHTHTHTVTQTEMGMTTEVLCRTVAASTGREAVRVVYLLAWPGSTPNHISFPLNATQSC